MKPFIHARNSAKRYGGVPEDYLFIHNWMDSTKAATAKYYHRAILHNSFGIFLAEQLFGVTMVNSDNKTVSIRDLAEDHVKEDCAGRIPTIDEWFQDTGEPKPWMIGRGQKKYLQELNLEAD